VAIAVPKDAPRDANGNLTPEAIKQATAMMEKVVERLFGQASDSIESREVLSYIAGNARTHADIASYHAHRVAHDFTKYRSMRVNAVDRWLSEREKIDTLAGDERAFTRLRDVTEAEMKAVIEYAWSEERPSPQTMLEGCRIAGVKPHPEEATPEHPEGTVELSLEAANIVHTNAVKPEAVDGMLRPDARLAERIEAIGNAGRESAERMREGARERWRKHAEHQASGVPALMDDAQRFRLGKPFAAFDGPFDESAIWCLWLCLDDMEYPPWVRATIQALWLDVVRPTLERERAPESMARVSRGMVETFSCGRAHGGILAPYGSTTGAHILVEPPRGNALMLPFNEGVRVSKRDGSVVGLRQVLEAASMRTYLATLILFQDAGFRDDGSFEIDGPGSILDLTGVSKRKDPKGRTGYRFASKDTKAVQAHLELFSQMRVRVVGELEALAGDPLLDEIRNRRSGKVVTYAHSRLIVGQMRTDYMRTPRAVCRLEAKDVPVGMGIALVVRGKVVAHQRKGKPIEAPIRTWLEAAGIEADELARKKGRRFWDEAADMLARVAEEGELGRIARAGRGEDAVLTLEADADLLTSYEPLVKAAKARQNAKRTAMIVTAKEKLRG